MGRQLLRVGGGGVCSGVEPFPMTLTGLKQCKQCLKFIELFTLARAWSAASRCQFHSKSRSLPVAVVETDTSTYAC
jgi:hypothetical protein